MGWLYRNVARPILFTRDSEEIHDRTLAGLGWVGRHGVLCDALESFFADSKLPARRFGLDFPNPIGLAAGMDKQAVAVPVWSALGFGFTELGGVTWHPQPGNPSPRMFRAVPDGALINRMGFNNPGAEALAERLAGWRASGRWPKHPVGINLGKSKVTPVDEAARDYANSYRVLRDLADFFVVNVSSPNTPNLRQLQDKAALNEILAELQVTEAEVQTSKLKAQYSESRHGVQGPGSRVPSPCGAKPILVKVAPDLSLEALDEILELVESRGIAGIVATNTTIERPGTNDTGLRRVYSETGGLSGRPLAARSTGVIRHLYRRAMGSLPIIGVGGIFNAEDAWEKITAGASLVQLYTGLVYEGPSIVADIVGGLHRKLIDSGMRSLEEAVGSEPG